MDRDEERVPVDVCVECGVHVTDVDRGFSVSDESVLCQVCAMRRGGQWDERLDRWSHAPSIDDLLAQEPPR